MTVAELVAKLKAFPQTLQVCCEDDAGEPCELILVREGDWVYFSGDLALDDDEAGEEEEVDVEVEEDEDEDEDE